jgi:hypothetical protein
MSNEHLPIDYPWSGLGWANHIRDGLDRIGHHAATKAIVAGLSGAIVYIAAAMMAFVVAIDGYVLLHTM